MTKTELIRDMQRYVNGGFITRQKLANYMGKKDPHNVDKYLHGIPRIGKKDYFIPEVAEQMFRVGFGSNGRNTYENI